MALPLPFGLSEVFPDLLAILGLLMTWELHDLEVRAGRIRPRGLRTTRRPSAIRMVINATPSDSRTCPVCRRANGRVFFPATVAKKKFRRLASPCTNPGGCRCLMVGLVGDWPAAEQVLRRLSENRGMLLLSSDEMEHLLTERPEGSDSALVDRISVYMLQAMRAQKENPNFAICRYRFIVRYARDKRDLPFVVPAYLCLSELLEQSERPTEALEVVNEFLSAHGKMRGPSSPTQAQLIVMISRKNRLQALLNLTGPLGRTT